MITNKKELRLYLEMDQNANGINYHGLKNKLKWLINPKLHFTRNLRFLEYYTNTPPHLYNKMMKSYHYGIHMLLSFKLGYTVPVNVVGPGILFGHMGTILINKKAKLGKNCILNCLINIGGERHGAPQIDDGVYVASGSYIYGPVKIGRHAIISGAKVHTNIPPYAIVSGNPAKIVGYKMTPEEIVEFEKDHYPENERISIEKLRKNYDKYFLNKERIAEYLSLY